MPNRQNSDPQTPDSTTSIEATIFQRTLELAAERGAGEQVLDAMRELLVERTRATASEFLEACTTRDHGPCESNS